MKRKLAISLFGLSVVLSGCTLIKTYKSSYPKNFTVSGKSSSGVRTSLHIHSISKSCKLNYIGTVGVRDNKKRAGLPLNQKIYLEVEYFTSSFLWMNNKSTSYGVVINPRKGYTYTLKSQYNDDVYDVSLHYNKRGSKNRYEVPVVGIDSCTDRI